jgi:hypothetical protein
MSKLTVACSDWRPLRKNTLCGFARVRIVELDLVVIDVGVHRKGDRIWAQLPARPWVKDGAVVTDEAGKVQPKNGNWHVRVWLRLVHFHGHDARSLRLWPSPVG